MGWRARPEAPPARDGPADADIDLFITAAEAYPAFERVVLGATREIVAGFRIFDFSTRLRSEQARSLGEDWFDLILHKLREGVSFRLVLSDFDPIVATELHGLTWRSMRMAAALAELAGPDARIEVTASLHPAAVGVVAKLALWPRVHGLMDGRLREVQRKGDRSLSRFLARHPHFASLLARTGGRLRPRVWPLPSLWPVTHHQKTAVIDGEWLYIGGLDLNERRWDTPDHVERSEETWHDIQILVRDADRAAAVATHLGELGDVIGGDREASDLDGRVLRTLSAKPKGRPSILAPNPVRREIEAVLLAEIAQAERLIYIETQYLRDRRIARALAARAAAAPGLELMLILPAAPEDVAFQGTTRSDARFGEFLQASCIRKLRRAFRGRLFVGAPVQPEVAQGGGRSVLHGAPMIYVHAKVCVIDARVAIVGSANLNGRSLRWDTELAIPLRDPATVRRLRDRCLRNWLGTDLTEDGALIDPDRTVRAWQRQALVNARAHPDERVGFLVPYLTAPAKRFGRDLPAVPDEMV
ncbi:phospholipase D family protein [Jannaschia ovalis]|uniref:Phospholipase D n=1 Tax=Jannaschia ovalis TaxID=3038773 RepID=A0ABY8L8M4_9RHOB|nr:phospholipase D-like domain-containing protein [Jannaschia sp. GRR-S6-38]WGH77710.1 phospholipase D-like domain-containing protein [Jannaschia sp. GRR-S6-38]